MSFFPTSLALIARGGIFCAVLLVARLLVAEDPPAQGDYNRLLATARDLVAQEDFKAARKVLTTAIEQDPDRPDGYSWRAAISEQEGLFQQAQADLQRLIQLEPKQASFVDRLGAIQFQLGNIQDAVANFDRAVALQPSRGPGHWRRGIAYYYAGQFTKGIKQFEGYQTVDDSDVENAVWRFLCMAQRHGLQKARQELLKIGEDRRVPMRQIYDLYAGTASEEDVLAACRSGSPNKETLNHRLFYAHQYLGLYAEASGKTEQSLRHTRQAVEHKIGHYMWDVARVHLQLREASLQESSQRKSPTIEDR